MNEVLPIYLVNEMEVGLRSRGSLPVISMRERSKSFELLFAAKAEDRSAGVGIGIPPGTPTLSHSPGRIKSTGTPWLEDCVGAAPAEDVMAAASGAAAREARLLVTTAIEATVVEAARTLIRRGALTRRESKPRTRIEATVKHENGSRLLRDHLGGSNTIVAGEKRPASGSADCTIAAVRGGIKRPQRRDVAIDGGQEKGSEDGGATLGHNTGGDVGQPDPDNVVEGVDHSKSGVAFWGGQNGDMIVRRNELKGGKYFSRSRDKENLPFVKDDDGPAPSSDEFGRTVSDHLRELQERRRSQEQGAAFQRHRRMSRRQTIVLERTLAHELEVVRQEICPAGEEEAEREEESQLAMLRLTRKDLAGLFKDDEGRDGSSIADERGQIRNTRGPTSRGPWCAASTMGAVEGSVGRGAYGVIHSRTPAGGSGRVRSSSVPWTSTEPGPEEALAAGARRRSMLIEASNGYAGNATKPSRMRRKSQVLGKTGTVTVLTRKWREAGAREEIRTQVGGSSGTAADGTHADQSDALLLGGESKLGRNDRDDEKPGSERKHIGLGDVIVREGESVDVVGVGRESIRRRPRGPKGPGPVILNASQCEYAVVRECAIELGWHVCETKFSPHSDPLTKKERTTLENPHTTADAAYACTHQGMCNRLWNIMWHDHGNFEEHLKGLQSFQYYSHLPGLSFFARKAGLALLMSRMHQEAPKEFHFFPETWVLPTELQEFRLEFGANCRSDSVFIIKPDSGCQGKGIFLTNKVEKVAELSGKSVAQRYLTNPLLIDGYKFDLRLYVLVTSVDPMRIFLFNDGLVRICTELYQVPTADNLHNVTMHLTNYSVNKASSNFTSDDTGEHGFKRSLKWFRRWLDEHGHDSAAIWARLADVCVKTLITVGPMLRKEHKIANPGIRLPRGGAGREDGDKRGGAPVPLSTRHSSPPLPVPPTGSTCFTIIGVDLMIDDHLQPWIIEINHLPSFRTDTGMDYRIKKELVFNTLSLLDIKVGARENWQMEMEKLRRGRLLGLPPTNDGAQEATRSFGGSGSAGGARPGHKKKKSSKIKGRTRTKTPEQDREDFEQSAKGGFERVFPPSQTAPNAGARYAKVVRVAEQVFAKLSSYRSPAHSPRSVSPPGSPLSHVSRGGTPPPSAGVLKTLPSMSFRALQELTPAEETQVDEPPQASQLAAGASSTSQSSTEPEDESGQPVAKLMMAARTAVRTPTPCGDDDLLGGGAEAAEDIARDETMMNNRSQKFSGNWQRSNHVRKQHQAWTHHIPQRNEGASTPSQDRKRSFGFGVGDAAGGDHRDDVDGVVADSDGRPPMVEAPSPAATTAGAESDRDALENRGGGTVSTPPAKARKFSPGSPLRHSRRRRYRHPHRWPPRCKRTVSARKRRRSKSPRRWRKRPGTGADPGGGRDWEKKAKSGRKMYRIAPSCRVEGGVKDGEIEGEDRAVREGSRGVGGACDGGGGRSEDEADLEEKWRSPVEVNHKWQPSFDSFTNMTLRRTGRYRLAMGHEGASGGGIGARSGLPESCCLRPVVPQQQQQRPCDLHSHQEEEWAPRSRSGFWPARSPVRPFSARSGKVTARSRWVATISTSPVLPWRSSGERTTGGTSLTTRDNCGTPRATHYQGQQTVKPAGVEVAVTVPSSVFAPFGSNLETAAAKAIAGDVTPRIGTTGWSHRLTTLSSSSARHQGAKGTAATTWGQGRWNGGGNSDRWRPIAASNHAPSSGATKLGAVDNLAPAAASLAHPPQAVARPSTETRFFRNASPRKAKSYERGSVGRGNKAVARPITPTVVAVSFFEEQHPVGPAVARSNSHGKTRPSTAVEGTASTPRPPPHPPPPQELRELCGGRRDIARCRWSRVPSMGSISGGGSR